jgi:penicillin-binding protein 1C
MRDNWTVGFSSAYTVGVWVGNASGAPMWSVSGTSGAAPIWALVMNHLHQRAPSRAPAAPAGLVQTSVTFSVQSKVEQAEATRSEWFIQGTEQSVITANSGSASATGISLAPRITAPTSGSIIALDPDIPPNRQRLTFAAQGSRQMHWLMDGKEFARGPNAQWLPWPGRHTVQLVDVKGVVLDEIKLEVRGAGLKVEAKQ